MPIRIFTDEHRKNLSKAAKGKKLSKEHKKNLSKALKGRIFTDEHRKKIGKANKNPSHETRMKMSIAQKGKIPWNTGLTKETNESLKNISEAMKGDNNPMKSPEVRKKMSESNSGEKHWNYGKKLSDETKRKIGEENKGENNGNYGKTGEAHPMFGKHHTEESKKKIGEANKGNKNFFGKKHTEESKKKMSESHKGQIAWNKGLTKETSDILKKLSEARIGEKHPMYGIKRPEITGEKNPMWKGGISCLPYCQQWSDKEYKEDIKEYYNHKCMNPLCLCNSENLVLHHIDYVKKNCHWKNIIPVCRSSNTKANFDRWFWQEIYERIIKRRENV